MSTPTPARRPSRRALALAGAAVAVVLVALGVWLVSSGSDDPGSTSAAATSSSAGPTRPSAPVSMPASSAPPSTPEATGPTGDADDAPPSVDVVALDEPSSTGGVTARLTDVAVVQATGQGAGSVSGTALQVTVELVNGTGSELSLAGVDVTADTGEDRDPASPLDDGRTRGLAGSLPAGATAQGTYLFSLPDGATTATVSVAYQAGAPVLVFSGPVG